MAKIRTEEEKLILEAKREYYRQYRKENKKKIAEYNRKYRENHPEKIKEHNKKHWLKKAEELQLQAK